MSALSNYKKLKKIEKGIYGSLYQCFDKESSTVITIKKIPLEEEEEGLPGAVLRELSVLQRINNENVVKLNKCEWEKDTLFMIFDDFDYDLKSFIKNHPFQNFKKEYFEIIKQITKGLKYCHSLGILHRNLRPENIWLTKNDQNAKIADFSLSRIKINWNKRQKYTTEVMTLWYRPPEILLGEKYYDKEADIWSFACILGEIFNESPLFTGDSDIDQIYKIFQVFGTPSKENCPLLRKLPYFKNSFPKFNKKDNFLSQWPTLLNNASEKFIDLFEKILTINPSNRLSIEEIYEHPFFSN